jgi:hypothetical protein
MTDVQVSGPLYDGTAPGIIDRYMKSAKDKIGQHAEDEVHARLGEVIRHPTGYYEGHIHTEMQADDLVVTDTPVVYGPWLEGVGSRNSPKTRFPGYHTFLLVSQKLDGEAEALADAELDEGGYIEALNG